MKKISFYYYYIGNEKRPMFVNILKKPLSIWSPYQSEQLCWSGFKPTSDTSKIVYLIIRFFKQKQ